MGSASKAARAYLLAYNGALALSWCVATQPCECAACDALGGGAQLLQRGLGRRRPGGQPLTSLFGFCRAYVLYLTVLTVLTKGWTVTFEETQHVLAFAQVRAEGSESSGAPWAGLHQPRCPQQRRVGALQLAGTPHGGV